MVDLQAGPIPPGLKPQVDVMWNVMSERGCADHFGDRIARHYYCLEVQIGNNSGYALLLAGVGFLRETPAAIYPESNSTYSQVRAVLQREQVVSGRNITLRALQAAGVVIAGFTPFSGNAGRRGRLGIWSSFVGNIVAGAYEGLIPDRTIRQLANLDDAALRDGRLIPNNSPVKFTIFADREEIVPLLADDLCYKEYAKGQMQKEIDRINVDIAVAKRMQVPGTDLLVLEQSVAKLTAAVNTLIEQIADQKSKGTDPPATTKTSCESGIIPRNGRGLNPLGRSRSQHEMDLIAVRKALGRIIIVGDQIEYKQRIRVDSSATVSEVKPNPSIVGMLNGDTVMVTPGGEAKTITLLGRWLTGASVNLLNCKNTTFKLSVTSPGTALILSDFQVQADCHDPRINLLIGTEGTLPVQFSIPVGAAAKPEILKVTPNPIVLDEAKETLLSLVLNGKSLAGPKIAVTWNGVAIPNANATVTESAADHVNATIKLTADQAKGGAQIVITLTTPSGGVADSDKIPIKKK